MVQEEPPSGSLPPWVREGMLTNALLGLFEKAGKNTGRYRGRAGAPGGRGPAQRGWAATVARPLSPMASPRDRAGERLPVYG